MRFSSDYDETAIERIKTEEAKTLNALSAATPGVLQMAVAKSTGKASEILRSDQNSYAIVLSTDFNASIYIRESHFLLFVNLGFCKFFSEITRMLFSRINVISESMYKAGVQATKIVTIEETVSAAKVLMESFWDKELPDNSRHSRFELADGTNLLYNTFLVCGLRFALGHEFAHLLIEKSPGYERHRESGEAFVEHILKQNPGIPPDVGERLKKDWGLEFGADVLGLELSIEAEENSSLKWIQMYTAEWFFLMCEMLWRYHLKTRGHIEGSSHPEPFMRRYKLRNHVNDGYEQRI